VISLAVLDPYLAQHCRMRLALHSLGDHFFAERVRDSVDRLHERTVRRIRVDIASASHATLTIAKRNNEIAENFSAAIESLATTGSSFDVEVGRFRL
jgi:hypothetical protein